MIADQYFVYILKCADGTLYCGYTNNLNARVKTHNLGKGAKYTKTRLPVELVYHETFDLKNEALSREYAIKQLTRVQKLQLIDSAVSQSAPHTEIK
ncbi:MAG: GIY-YIG nuclease family protein [Clostridia bacterium]